MKSLLRAAITSSLMPFTGAWGRINPGIRILMYHRVDDLAEYDQLTVSVELFEQQMSWLFRSFNVISLEQACSDLGSPVRFGSVVVTFDDGYLDNYTNAFPILKKYRIPATIFVTTEFLNQSISHPRYHGKSNGKNGRRLHFNQQELREMNNDTLITIGSHTTTHPYLPELNDNMCMKEIVESKSILEDILSDRVDYFCYPSGDFSDREVGNVRVAGYRAAVSVAPGLNRQQSNRYTLSRTEVTDHDSVSRLNRKMNGAYDPLHQLLHWRRLRQFRSRNTGMI